MYKLSVIIPVFNAKDYLERCLDSVCNQTLKDIEIICVNDCSKDNSLDILRNYAEKYSSLKIIDCKENGGESKARNIGLDSAAGEYIAFVDNDDEIDLDFCEKLYNKAIETNADIVKGEVIEISYSGKKTYGELNKTIRSYNNDKLFFTYHWWSAIYKNALIKENNIQFVNGYPLGGDILFLNQAILASKKLELVDDVFYHYYRRKDSGDSLILNEEKLLSVLRIYVKCIKNLNNCHYIDFNSEGYQIVCYWYIRHCISLAFRNKTKSYKEICADYLLELYKSVVKISTSIDVSIRNDFSDAILKGIKNEDKRALVDYLSDYSSVMKLMLLNIQGRKRNEIK